MANITYLIGAGASANCLPCVNQIPQRLGELSRLFSGHTLPERFDGKQYLPKIKNDDDWNYYKQLIVNDLTYLKEKSTEYTTIDTYAKYLYLIGNNKEYKKILQLLSYFFIVEQIIRRPDNRYMTFFANILDRSEPFPNNINILSWNYDSQFEIAYEKFNVQHKLVVGTQQDKSYKQYKLINLNGVATFDVLEGNSTDISKYRNNVLKDINPFSNSLPEIFEVLYKLIILYVDCVSDYDNEKPTSKLSFAFEGEYSLHNEVYRRIDEIIENTNALVIIGYTFPFFNRNIDRRVLQNLKSGTKVYIQDIYPERIKQNFGAVMPNIKDENILLQSDVSQFFLPPEL